MHVKMLMGIPFGPLKVGKTCAREMITSVNITKNDYQEAVQSLESFDVVLTLDSVKKQPEKVACVLSRALGWNMTLLPKKNVKQRQNKKVIEQEDFDQGSTGECLGYTTIQTSTRVGTTNVSIVCLSLNSCCVLRIISGEGILVHYSWTVDGFQQYRPGYIRMCISLPLSTGRMLLCDFEIHIYTQLLQIQYGWR